MTSPPSINYEALQKEAMRSVVRTVLTNTAKYGLPGDHHFYISFDTTTPGVSLSKRLLEKYPHEMTIVLQHRFWDLDVKEDAFEVKLTFDGIPERLVVPFNALKVFFDPSVRYGLQFEDGGEAEEKSSSSKDMNRSSSSLSLVDKNSQTSRKVKISRKNKSEKFEETENSLDKHKSGEGSEEIIKGRHSDNTNQITEVELATPAVKSKGSEDLAPPKTPPQTGAEVVSLDKFRKK